MDVVFERKSDLKVGEKAADLGKNIERRLI